MALAGRAARLLLIAAPCAAVMLALRENFVALPALSGLAVYAGGVLLLPVLHRDDWDLIYRLATALPGGGYLRRVWKRDTQLSW